MTVRYIPNPIKRLWLYVVGVLRDADELSTRRLYER